MFLAQLRLLWNLCRQLNQTSCFAEYFQANLEPHNMPKLFNHTFQIETSPALVCVILLPPPPFSFLCKTCDIFSLSSLQKKQQNSSYAFHFPPLLPPPLSSSSRLFLMLSYSSSMFWLPRIWLSTRRAFWVSPRWINQRGLSGRNRNPMNWSTAGSTDRPNMYLNRKGKER